MVIKTSDGKITVNVGSADIWHSVYSTVFVCLAKKAKHISSAIAFMENGNCSTKDCLETARQFNLIRDGLSNVEPAKAVYDLNDKKKVAPWKNKMSPVITSCANMYTTSDGKDLLSEVVGILSYAYYAKADVTVE